MTDKIEISASEMLKYMFQYECCKEAMYKVIAEKFILKYGDEMVRDFNNTDKKHIKELIKDKLAERIVDKLDNNY